MDFAEILYKEGQVLVMLATSIGDSLHFYFCEILKIFSRIRGGIFAFQSYVEYRCL